MNYALIKDGIVANIISLEPRNAQDFPDAVALGDRPVGSGDTYDNGVFLRDGKPILTPQEEKEKKYDETAARVEEMDSTINAALMGLVQVYEMLL